MNVIMDLSWMLGLFFEGNTFLVAYIPETKTMINE